MKNGTMRKPTGKKELDSETDTPADIESPDDTAPEPIKSTPKAGARVVERSSKTVTYTAPVKGKGARAAGSDEDDEDDEDDDYIDDVPDPLAFLRTSTGETDFPVTMSIFGIADKTGKLYSKEEVLVYGQYDVDPETYYRDLGRIVPEGGAVRIDFRWASRGGPLGQKPGSIAHREKLNLVAARVTPTPTGSTNGHAQPVDVADLKRSLRAEMREEMKFYKEMAGGGGSGNGSFADNITLLNSLGLLRKPDEGSGLSKFKEFLEIKEMLGGGDATNGWTIARDIVGDLTESFGPIAAELIRNRMTEINKNGGQQTAAPAYDADAPAVNETIPEAVPLQLSPDQQRAFDELRRIAILDYLTNSPVDATALKAGEYVKLNPQHAMEIIAFLMANPVSWLAQQASDPGVQKQIQQAPHGREWFQRLNNKILSMR
jgi:hypothetical protein